MLQLAIDNNVGMLRDDFASKIVAQLSQSLPFRLSLACDNIERGRKTRRKRRIFSSASKSSFLTTTENDRRECRSIRYIECADAAGAIELAGAERHEIDTKRM